MIISGFPFMESWISVNKVIPVHVRTHTRIIQKQSGCKKVRGQSQSEAMHNGYKRPKGGQVTKPIIVVKMPCKLLHVIQVKGFFLLDIRVFGHL